MKKLFFSLILTFTALSRVDANAKEAESAFRRAELSVGGVALKIEIAQSEKERERGLMHRKKLGEGEGMLFIFPDARKLTFWMKNTLIPLSIGFFDSKGELFQIRNMEPASIVDDSPPLYGSSGPAKYALEVNKGWFERHKVKTGCRVRMPLGK